MPGWIGHRRGDSGERLEGKDGGEECSRPPSICIPTPFNLFMLW